jgi:hypothetical protein
MNAEIRRQGIVIKTVPITSNRVCIGSGEACEIQLSDQFLAPVVAELVLQGQEWRIIDAGVSLEGVTRGGSRVMDERLERGESYIVGAFELVIDPQHAPRPSLEQPRPDAGSLPMTMMEADLGILPSTVVQGAVPVAKPAGASRQQAANKLVFAPVEAPRGGPPPDSRVAPKPSPRRPLLLVAAVAITTICIALAVVMGSGAKKAARPPAAGTAPATQSAPPAPAVRGPSGDELAANLEVDKAFAAWEAEFAAKPSTELRDKIVSGAFELGRAYAAAHDAQTAARYFAKVERYGDPDSDIVRLARARIGT